MSDISGQLTQSAAPGSLLRTVAETNAQDPTKSQNPNAQPSAPIRQLTQEPIQSTLPQGTPRVLNVVPSQQPNPDFTGLHALLSAAPVPDAHTAATLIRALMTPPGQSGVVAPRAPVASTPSVSTPSATTPTATTPGSNGVVAPSQPTINPTSAPAQTRSSSAPTAPSNPSNGSYGPAQVQRSTAPTTQANRAGINYFIPGSIQDAAEKFGGTLGDVAETVGHIPGLRFLNPVADVGAGLGLANTILSRFGLGNWFQPRQAS